MTATVPPVETGRALVSTLTQADLDEANRDDRLRWFAWCRRAGDRLVLRGGAQEWYFPGPCSADWPWEGLAPGTVVPGTLEVTDDADPGFTAPLFLT